MKARPDILALWHAALNFCTGYDPEGFREDLDGIRNLPPPSAWSDQDVYLEYCWVVLHAGVSTVVARAIQDRIWPIIEDRPLSEIARHEGRIRAQLLRVYRNKRKVDYMLSMAKTLVADPGIGPRLEQMGVEEALRYLQTLPGIGPVTKYHLARNIGFDVVKPDRHLTRLAGVVGTTPDELCRIVSEATGERIGAVDFTFYQWCAWAGFDSVAGEARVLCPSVKAKT